MLFAPIGTSLATHTYVPLMTVSAAYALPSATPAALYNGAVLLAVFLNFACAYAAAFSMTRDSLASVFAALVFGGAPFLTIRASAHLNVLSAWGLPLALAATASFVKQPTAVRGVWIAIALALVAYTDYYYFVFGALMAALLMTLSIWDVTLVAQSLTRVRQRAMWTIGALLVLVVGAAAAIGVTGGGNASLGPIRLRMTDTFNARVLAGFLIFAFLLVWKRPALRLQRASSRHVADVAAALIPGAVVFVALMSPLLASAFSVWRAGDYTTQTYVWRSAPPGIDIASLFMGSPINPLTGGWTGDRLRGFGINIVEGAAWLGIAPMVMAAVAWRLKTSSPEDFLVRACFWIAGVFFVWALGPYVRILGYNTGVMLPQTLLRYVPIAANARIPGRAFAVVQLMAAMLGAIALASLPGSARRRTMLAGAAIAGVLLDFVPAARTWTPLETPRVYDILKNMPQGILLNIPLGLRDGFGARGNPQDELLFYQTTHAHPQMGGFVARLSSRITSAYENDPVLEPILDFSEGREPKSLPAGPCRNSLACNARYIAIDQQAASPSLQQFIRATFPSMTLADRDGSMALYINPAPGL